MLNFFADRSPRNGLRPLAHPDPPDRVRRFPRPRPAQPLVRPERDQVQRGLQGRRDRRQKHPKGGGGLGKLLSPLRVLAQVGIQYIVVSNS